MKVSFNPIVKRGYPRSEEGGCVEEPLRPECKIKNTEERVKGKRKEDILFVFMWLLNDWVQDHNENTIRPCIAKLTSFRSRTSDYHITEPTYKELEDFCKVLMNELNRGENITISGSAGRMMIRYEPCDTCDIKDVRTLQLCLSKLQI